MRGPGGNPAILRRPRPQRIFKVMRIRRQPLVTLAIWLVLLAATVLAVANGRWETAFVSVAALVLTFLPVLFVSRFQIHLPARFVAAISIFVFATMFLGEVFDFYERIWWWDIALHGSSAIGFGILGFLFVFMLFEGDRYAAPAAALGVLAFCVAITIGALWEIFEFAMDQLFGMNMQKSGLDDTMWDMIVNAIGASIGGFSGFLYMLGRERAGLSPIIGEFVTLNRHWFRKRG